MPYRHILITFALVTFTACGLTSTDESKDVITIPEFKMTAISASKEIPFGRKDMLGNVWIADFIFTHCSGPCPLLTQRLSDLSKSLPESVKFMSVTVDPETDTPDRLRTYARTFSIDLNRWVFLRGTMSQTYELLYSGFHLPMSSDPQSPPQSRVMHSTRFVLIDKNGVIRGYFDGLGDLDKAAIAREARRLLEVGS